MGIFFFQTEFSYLRGRPGIWSGFQKLYPLFFSQLNLGPGMGYERGKVSTAKHNCYLVVSREKSFSNIDKKNLLK